MRRLKYTLLLALVFVLTFTGQTKAQPEKFQTLFSHNDTLISDV